MQGPFYPAGLLNSGNSCFWNALVQALFAATPVFRGALFQLDFGDGRDADRSGVLRRLRDLFAEMDMGLAGAIDAGELYRLIFKRAEEADVSEQMQRLFELATGGPGPLKEVHLGARGAGCSSAPGSRPHGEPRAVSVSRRPLPFMRRRHAGGRTRGARVAHRLAGGSWVVITRRSRLMHLAAV